MGYEIMRTDEDRLLSFTSFGTTAQLKTSNFMVAILKFTYKLLSMKLIARLSTSSGISDKAKLRIREMITEADKSSILNLIPHLGNFDYRDVIKNSKVKSLIIAGEKDKEINKVLDSTIEAFEQRGNFQQVDFKKAGHFANLDQSDRFNEILANFIAD